MLDNGTGMVGQLKIKCHAKLFSFQRRQNPFELFDEEEFRFRFQKYTAMDIIDLISEEIVRPISRRSVPRKFQVLTALCFYGTFSLPWETL